MPAIYHTSALESLECCRCAMPIGLSKTWLEHARNVGHQKHQFWCPYCGTQQGWGQSRHEQSLAALQSKLDEAKREQAYTAASLKHARESRAEARAEAEHFRRSRDGMKGVVAKIKKRVAHGVCPCCSRTFVQLARHMKTKHPEYGVPIEEPTKPIP